MSKFGLLRRASVLSVLLLLQTSLAAGADSKTACSLMFAWPYPGETSTEIRAPDGYQVVLIKQQNELIEVRYGDAAAADRDYNTQFSMDQPTRLIGRSRVRHWHALASSMALELRCGSPPVAAHWQQIGSAARYTYRQYRSARCVFQEILDPQGAVRYRIIMKRGTTVHHLGSDVPYGWKPQYAAQLFNLECRSDTWPPLTGDDASLSTNKNKMESLRSQYATSRSMLRSAARLLHEPYCLHPSQ
jgi:hypothetical protein